MMGMAEKMHMRRQTRNSGFTLLEMTISTVVMLVITGVVFGVLSFSQKIYGSQQLQADMHSGMRGVIELMTQEIGQAGSLSFAPKQVVAPGIVAPAAAAQAMNVTSTTGMFVNEWLTVDSGAQQELVQVVTIPTATQITAKFGKTHAVNQPIVAYGVFPNGILTTAAGNTLQLFGDIQADGTITFVRYDCNPGTPAAPGTLTRSITVVAPGVAAKNPPQILLNNLIANPAGTACFTPSMGMGGAVAAGNCTVGATAFTCVTDVQVMLTVQSAEIDPVTGTNAQMTKSFMNVASRNIFAAYEISKAAAPNINLMQLTPPALPLP